MTAFRTFARTAGRLLPSFELTGLAVFILSLALLVFLWGFAAAYFRFFPFRSIENAILSASALIGLQKDWGAEYKGSAFANIEGRPAYLSIRTGEPGAVTVINYFHEPEAHLVDARGNRLHTWRPEFSDADKRSLHELFAERFSGLDKARHLNIQDLHIHADGSATLMLNVVGRLWPYGVGLAKVDRDSNLLWKSFVPGTHHAFDIGPDGRIYALAYREYRTPAEGLDLLPRPYRDTEIVILGPQGGVVDRISLLAALAESKYAFYLENGNFLPLLNAGPKGDYLHANDVDVVTAAQARVFSYAEEGDLLVSMRDIHAVGVLDVKSRKFKWLERGPWLAQHDPDILPNGNLLIFDNLGADTDTGRSRILEYDPRTDRVIWSYAGSAEQPFETEVRGSQQSLPDGNVLISESMGGRVFEVSRTGETVWQLMSPFRFGDKKQYAPVVRWPRRLYPEDFDAGFRTYLRKAAQMAKPLGAEQTARADSG